MALTDKLKAIANAIRSKTGTTNTMTLDEMSDAINSIQTGIITSDNRCTTIPDYLFYGCNNLALTQLPSGITRIGSNAFYGCTKLALTKLPSGIIRIEDHAFNSCIGLTTLTFQRTPETISKTAFSYCNNLTTINVPWAEGAVANAPWGATKATINYNYVEK